MRLLLSGAYAHEKLYILLHHVIISCAMNCHSILWHLQGIGTEACNLLPPSVRLARVVIKVVVVVAEVVMKVVVAAAVMKARELVMKVVGGVAEVAQVVQVE